VSAKRSAHFPVRDERSDNKASSPSYVAEELGIEELPDGWRIAPLGGFLTEAQYGLSVKGGPEGRCPILRMTNQVNGRIKAENLQYADVTDKQLKSHRVEPGDLLFNRTNSLELVGRTAVFDLPGDYVFASYLIRLRTKADEVGPEFLNFYLGGEETQKRLKGIATRAVSQSNISATRLQGFQIPLPPLPEQKKIAQILSTVQRAIEAQERIIQTTTELKKALMHMLFTEGLRNEPQKQTEIGPVPESWEVVEIGDLGKCVTGSTPKTKVASFYHPPSEDFIAPADIGARRYVYDSEKKISPEGMKTIRPIPKNAVMCVCIGSSIGKVGMSYREQSATNQQINSIICKKGRDPEFVYYLLSYRWEYWKSFATFGPVPILSKGRFTSIAVAIPSAIEDQQAIAKPLVALEAKVEVAEKKVAALQDIFRTLLHELMTAKTRVHEFDLSMPKLVASDARS